MLKEGAGVDGFISWLHVLVLIDDTVLIAITRENMIKKLKILKQYCNEYGVKTNHTKTNFFVVNGSNVEKESLCVDDLVVEWCDNYVYLGSPFTADGSVSSVVRAHATAKIPHALKFVSFLKKNNDIPFFVKRRVLDAALISALLYGCESWLTADLKPITSLYNWCLKELLGVRRSTCNDVCYIEAGYPSLHQIVKNKQHTFFRKMWQEKSDMVDDPLIFAINLAIDSNSPTSRLIRRCVMTDAEEVHDDVTPSLRNRDSSRRKTYVELNPSLTVHNIYTARHSINEIHRISFTRFRVSSHNLACETGRWNRRGRGRLPLHERVCECGLVQMEAHVVEHWPNTQHLRQHYQFTTVHELLYGNLAPDVMCKVIHEILTIYG